MKSQVFKPNPQYLAKLFLVYTLIAGLIAVASVLLAWLISLDEGARAGRNIATVFLSIDFAFWVVAIILIGPYYRSLSYEIQDDEVIVRVGILTKTIKHVPYRTVTNISVKRDIFDRWFFGIGSLNIQTAGMSGSKGVEESLVGLPNVQEIYEMVAGTLRQFRGGMSPTQSESDVHEVIASAETLNSILSEVRAIRRAKER